MAPRDTRLPGIPGIGRALLGLGGGLAAALSPTLLALMLIVALAVLAIVAVAVFNSRPEPTDNLVKIIQAVKGQPVAMKNRSRSQKDPEAGG